MCYNIGMLLTLKEVCIIYIDNTVDFTLYYTIWRNGQATPQSDCLMGLSINLSLCTIPFFILVFQLPSVVTIMHADK